MRILWWSFFTGLFLIAVGAACNILVSAANGWKMPFATKPDEILFVIGDPQYGVSKFSDPDIVGEMPVHQPIKPGMHFLIFADRIPVHLWFLDGYTLKQPVYGIAVLVNAPINGDGIVSLGDIAMWIGLVLFLPSAIPLFPFIVWNIILFAGRKMFRRKKK